MPSLTISEPHDLTHAEAISRIKDALKKEKAAHGGRIKNLRESCNGHKGEFAAIVMGFRVSGTMHIKPIEVTVTGRYPILALPWKSRIEAKIWNVAERILS